MQFFATQCFAKQCFATQQQEVACKHGNAVMHHEQRDAMMHVQWSAFQCNVAERQKLQVGRHHGTIMTCRTVLE
jgi:hypothetical protein